MSRIGALVRKLVEQGAEIRYGYETDDIDYDQYKANLEAVIREGEQDLKELLKEHLDLE